MTRRSVREWQRPLCTLPAQQAGLVLSESCIERIRQITAKEGNQGIRLRVTVDAGGCSGFQYQFTLDDELDDEVDRVFAQDGVEVVTDTISLGFLEGSTIDYKVEMVSSSFRVSE